MGRVSRSKVGSKNRKTGSASSRTQPEPSPAWGTCEIIDCDDLRHWLRYRLQELDGYRRVVRLDDPELADKIGLAQWALRQLQTILARPR